MDVPQLPLNALRAFEASARLCNFTRAGQELNVTQTAISHQVKALEDQLGVTLFTRLPRGLALTDEGHALLPVLTDAFERISGAVTRLQEGRFQEVVTLGVVGTFAIGWLLPRLSDFRDRHPSIDLRLKTNNNVADIVAEGLDYFIRFGDGAWHGTDALPLLDAPLSPVCAPALADQLKQPADLHGVPLLRSFRRDEWERWFQAAGMVPPTPRGGMFDSSALLLEAAAGGEGVALLPVTMFQQALGQGRVKQPFELAVDTGRYWLTKLKSRQETPAMGRLREWLEQQLRQHPNTDSRPSGAPPGHLPSDRTTKPL
ncbi:putative beta lactamase transcriptional activator [Alloalcanivorax dieselolei B5]|uniref:Putative beta lactamase transcriptional activator n=1 Tax=Alcanivorax dieselolei (strain DSM 16502 / CGMCC 1.3690 / MCCC 1A00001 / B-5) TaxID=930169 RepID=K0CIY7_ALCDB|nr:LysR family transcriptional regulator [Alloalcanivorax dieselolei]AFT71677.1 putative beta lactamase transcriptional activator [Alloalcanivorax dieselolei B5]GGJ88834.1 LysR family transcriptional regulator [Alloalcanivorax dieselolei]